MVTRRILYLLRGIVNIYDIEKRSVTVFDGLHQDIRKWQGHIVNTVKTYGLKPLFSSATCVQLPSFGMALEIRFNDS